MQQRLYCFLVVLLLIFAGNVFSQAKDSSIPHSLFFRPDIGRSDAIRIGMVQPDFYTTHLGLICRKELQIEKSTSIPIRLRLGSLEYTNYLEHKPNARKPEN